MKYRIRNLVSLAVLSAYVFAFAGCNGKTTDAPVASTTSTSDSTDHDDHDHDDHDHDDHDHPAHGPNGGHMVELGDEMDVEWMMEEEEGVFTILFPEDEAIDGVQMKTKIADTENVYAFEQAEDPVNAWVTTSPELATAVMMGDAVETTLVVTTEGGESTAAVKYHKH